MRASEIPAAIEILRRECEGLKTPYVTEVAGAKKRDPFRVLISCILSLRTRDETTREASIRLFALASTPRAMARLSAASIEKAVYPVGFYRVKARNIKEICSALIEKHGGRVPDTIDGLLELKGVGRKTANLVVTMGYGKPGICVDTHVHRITNRWGLVSTSTPEKTEFALRERLPAPYWLEINDLLVTFGQNICTPISPRCSGCGLRRWCRRVGVDKHR